MKTLKIFSPYLILLLTAFIFSYSTVNLPFLQNIFQSGIAGFYLSLALLFTVGYWINYFAPKTSIPIFVWALLFGMALQIPLISLVKTGDETTVIINLLASLILFAGGISIPTKNFKKYFTPIATLSILGTILTILIFAIFLSFLTTIFGIKISAISLLVLSAILASIDPSTVIETLNKLHFRKPFIKDIAISESAMNDVTGIMLTRFFLISALSAGSLTTVSISKEIIPFFSKIILEKISLEIVWGIMVGFLGVWILKTWGESIGKKHWSDTALFFSVPILCFALGSIIGGSGFLAAFVAGLLFESEGRVKEVHDIFENLIDKFAKPIVFILLGVLAPVQMLVATMALGALCAIIFMFFVRPLIVYISLLPWTITKKSKFEWRELLFLSFIRETGAIPAVLLLYAILSGMSGGVFILSIAIWIILFTLIIEPPLTPLLGEFLKITD